MKNIKKSIQRGALACAAALALMFPMAKLQAKAEVRYNELDNLFQSTLNDVLNYENTEDTLVAAEKEMLYDVDLHELGVLYDFTYDEQEGFAILIDDGVDMKVTEIYTKGTSPYPDNGTQKIYVMENMYWYSDGEQFYDCGSGLPIAPESIEKVSEIAYRGTVEILYDYEQIDYVYRSQTPYNIMYSIPENYYGHEGGCAAVAGSNLIMFYDKNYPNLIPNYEPGKNIFTLYRFNAQDDTMRGVSETLHTDMSIGSGGATVSQFKSGIKKYVNRQGYSISFESLVSWGKFKYDRAKEVVQSQKAIAVFIKGYRATIISNGEGYDSLTYEYANANHVVAGFGCLEVNYTFADNTTRQDKYIHASLGVGLYRNGYINLTNKIQEALAITIS